MPPIMQDLEYLIQILKFCEKELTKVVPGGVVGARLRARLRETANDVISYGGREGSRPSASVHGGRLKQLSILRNINKQLRNINSLWYICTFLTDNHAHGATRRGTSAQTTVYHHEHACFRWPKHVTTTRTTM